MFFLTIVCVILIAITIAVVAVVNHGFNKITKWDKHEGEGPFDIYKEEKEYYEDLYNNTEKEEIELKSKDGLKLKGYYIKNKNKTNKVIVVVHGYTVTHTWGFQFAPMFLEEGFDVLLIDQRRHGASEGEYSTYGYYEKYDLDNWVNYVREIKGEEAVIGILGQSLGGGTVLEYCKINKYVSFIIADCPYSDLKPLLRFRLKETNKLLGKPFYYLIRSKAKRVAKFDFNKVSPKESIKTTNIPILFIHGDKDDYVPTSMSIDMYNSRRNNSRLVLIKNAAHAECYRVDKNTYEREVKNFLRDIL